MKINDLKDGMIVKCRGGNIYVVFGDKLLSECGYNKLSDYDDTLKIPSILETDMSEFDIMEVYSPSAVIYKLGDILNCGKLLWSRELPIKLAKAKFYTFESPVRTTFRFKEMCDNSVIAYGVCNEYVSHFKGAAFLVDDIYTLKDAYLREATDEEIANYWKSVYRSFATQTTVFCLRTLGGSKYLFELDVKHSMPDVFMFTNKAYDKEYNTFLTIPLLSLGLWSRIDILRPACKKEIEFFNSLKPVEMTTTEVEDKLNLVHGTLRIVKK